MEREREIIRTKKAPPAIGAYSQAVIANGFIFCSGQIGLKPEDMEMAGESVEQQTEQIIKNLEAVLSDAGSGLEKVVKCSIFLVDMDDFSAVNNIYASYFQQNPPARETLAVKTLPKNGLVEISCIALQ